MASKKSDQGSSNGSLPALRIGSRVRCADDGVEGRITWANGVSVKVQWDDGEQVTWRRDSLAGRPIEILDPAGEAEQAATIPEPADVGQSDTAEELAIEQPPVPSALEEVTTGKELPAAGTAVPAVEPATVDPVPPTHEQNEGMAAPVALDATAEMTVSSKRGRKAPA